MTMEQIARDIREGTFPKKSEATLREEATQQRPPRQYKFTEIGEQIIGSLIKAADEQVKDAEDLRLRVMQLADSIATQLKEHAKLLGDMDERMHSFGAEVLEAHKKLINGGKHENPSP